VCVVKRFYSENGWVGMVGGQWNGAATIEKIAPGFQILRYGSRCCPKPPCKFT